MGEMRRFAAKSMSALAMVLLSAWLLAVSTAAQGLPPPPIKIDLDTDKDTYGPTEAIPIQIKVYNDPYDTVGEVVANKAFTSQQFHLALRIRDPDGQALSLVSAMVAPEPGPPFRYEGRNLVPVEVIPVGYEKNVGLPDARTYYKFGAKYGWYTAQVQVPLETFSRVSLDLNGNLFSELEDQGRLAYNPLSSNLIRFQIQPPEPIVTSSINVRLNLVTVGPGSKPDARRGALENAPVRIYKKASIPADFSPIGWKVYPAIWISVDPLKSALTDSSGIARFANMEKGDYLILAQYPMSSEFSYVAVSVSETDKDWVQGGVLLEEMRVVQKSSGSKVPGKTTRLSGSDFLITEPEFIEWNSNAEAFPFVFEAVGKWQVTTSITPPSGKVDNKSLATDVTDGMKAVQFVANAGTKWVETIAQMTVSHGKTSYKITDRIGVKLSKDMAKANKKTIYGDLAAPGPFEGGRKIQR
jgi:hypothetical protein